MKLENDIFNNNMDERSVEAISKICPVLSDEEKNRIFAKIEEKLSDYDNDMNFHSGNIKHTTNSFFHNILKITAAVTVIAGTFSICSLMSGRKENSNNSKNDTNDIIIPAASVTSNISSYETRPVSRSESSALSIATAPQTEAPQTSVILETDIMITEEYTSYAESETPVSTVPSGTDPTEPVLTDISEQSCAEIPEILTLEQKADILTNRYCEVHSIIYSLINKTEEYIVLSHKYGSEEMGTYDISYRKVDPEVYKNIDEIKEVYYSVMYPNENAYHIFGPDIGSDSSYIFDEKDPDYIYITYCGSLYARNDKLTDNPLGTPVPDGDTQFYSDMSGYHSSRKYSTLSGEKILIFYFDINQDTGKMLISNVIYMDPPGAAKNN